MITELTSLHTPESLAAKLAGQPHLVLLRSAPTGSDQDRYSFVTRIDLGRVVDAQQIFVRASDRFQPSVRGILA